LKQYIEKGLKIKSRARQRQKYKVGQKVRVQVKPGPFHRSYNYQSNLMRYTVESVDKSKPFNQYKLKDEKGNILKGYFLQREIVGIDLGDKYRARQKRVFTQKGKRYAELEYLGYPSEYNEIVRI
jgi:hypothetical protein